jgi:hypothetical protein
MRQTRTLDFEYAGQATANDLREFLSDLPANPSVVIKVWDDNMLHIKIREIDSIEYDSSTNTVTIS